MKNASMEVSEAAAAVPPIFYGLNLAQNDAVLHGEGPLLIVAGAGTGKTTVVTRRIAHLVSSKIALPSEILALTFTEKAAIEMAERVDKLVPYGFNDVWVSTFHSFGDRTLREYSFEIGLSPDVKVLTPPEIIVFLRQKIFEFNLKFYQPLSDPTRFVQALLTVFSRAKDEDIQPQEFIADARKKIKAAQSEEEREAAEKQLEAGEAYRFYEELKRKNGFIDFGDQVVLCLKILRERPAVLKKIQSRYKFILVDEFQDTNYSQFEIVKLLAAAHKNITVVGDDDQSIYKFRGACLSNILGFRKAYPQAREVILRENYRSTQEILDAAYKLIQHNNPDRLEYQGSISKFLRAERGTGMAVRSATFDIIWSEAEFVAHSIEEKIKSGHRQARDFAILVRTNAGAEPFLKALSLAGIPWRFSGNAGLYEKEEIKIALSFLRAVDQPADSASLYYLAISPLYELDSEDCAVLTQIAYETRRPLLEVFQSHGADPRLSQSSTNTVRKIVSDIQNFRKLSQKIPTGQLLYRFFEESGVLKRLALSTDYRSAMQAQNLQRLFEIIKKFGALAAYDRVHYFIEYLEALRLAGEDPASAEASFDENAVQILTVHAAKGLEFPVVYLVGLEQGHFPLTDRPDAIELPESLIKDILPAGNFHEQEERRLFYVGMTRAKDELWLCSARDMGKKKIWKNSRFILEALDKPQADESVLKSKPLDSLKIFSGKESEENREFPLPKTDGSPLSLRATAVDDYATCPLKYKFAHLVRIPVLSHHTAVFGSAVHEALKGYHLARKEGKKMEAEELLRLFKNAWRGEGFISREHEEKRFQEGEKVLKSYHKKEEASSVLPAFVEESFRMNLENVSIRGRWDRVDQTGNEAVIIDYKTGDVKDQKDADKKARESSQLLLYALAYQNRFGKLPEKTVLSFVKSDTIGTSVPTEDRIEKMREAVRKVARGMENAEFPATPGYHCRMCAYEKICPAQGKP